MMYDIDPNLPKPTYPSKKRTGDPSHSDRFFIYYGSDLISLSRASVPSTCGPNLLYLPNPSPEPTQLHLPNPSPEPTQLQSVSANPRPTDFQIQKTTFINPGRLPGLCLNTLILSPKVYEALVRPVA